MLTTMTTMPSRTATASAHANARATRLSARRAPNGMGGSAIVAPRRATKATQTMTRRTTQTTITRALFNSSNDSQGKDNGATATSVSTDEVMIDPVVGAKRFSNYFWAGVVTAGSTGFLLTGASA